MTARSRMLVAALWALSLFGVAHWTAQAQVAPQPGIEVRFLKTQAKNGTSTGVLVANFGGQWLPVKLDDKLPDANGIFAR